MQRLFCKKVQACLENGTSVGSILLQKNGEKIAIEVLNIATGIQLDINEYVSQNITIDGQNMRLKVWKSAEIQSFGCITGPACVAHIIHKDHVTTITFILAEKSTTGHNPADLRLPLF